MCKQKVFAFSVQLTNLANYACDFSVVDRAQKAQEGKANGRECHVKQSW